MDLGHAMTHFCAECGVAGGVSLKTCKSCKLVRYCNANCQKNHWSKHKKKCKERATELRDEALFKDPPAKEDCPICFLPMPIKLICCMSLPPATISSVPIYKFAVANEEVAKLGTKQSHPCCGKSVCGGCVYSFRQSGNEHRCPFCNSHRGDKTDEENIEELMKRVASNDAGSMNVIGSLYLYGVRGLPQDRAKAIELWKQAVELGYSDAHYNLGVHYNEGGDRKKAKFHNEAAAMAGHEVARNWLGCFEFQLGNMGQAIKHWTIAASAGHYSAMFCLNVEFIKGVISRESINSTLTSYNNSCAEMISESRDATIRAYTNHN